MSQWWYCLTHSRVEPEEGCPNAQRLGPFDTRAKAQDALATAAQRNEEWDRDDREWNRGGSGTDRT